MLTGRILRGARAMLGWSQNELAQKSDVSISSIRRIEKNDSVSKVYGETYESIERILRQEGVTFESEEKEAMVKVRFL